MHVSILPQPPALFIWLYQDRLLKKEAGDVVGTFPALRKRVRCFRGTPKVRSRIVLPSVGAKLGHPLRYSAGFVQTFRLLRAGDSSSFAGPAKCCFVNPFYAKFVQTL